jgi:hypothetical protein
MEGHAVRVDPVLAALQRRWARLPAGAQLRVEIADLPVELLLRDLTFGGFAIVAPRPFWKGMTHRFTFATRAGGSLTLVAKAVYCSPTADGKAFVSGWEFMRGMADRTEAAIGRLLETLEGSEARKF